MITEPTREPRKQCSICKDYKLLTEFHKEQKKPMGVQSRCTLCKQRENAAYQERLRQEKLSAAEAKNHEEIANGNGTKSAQT